MKFNESIKGKRVLVRVDFNVPMDRGVILSDNRIRQTMPTIEELYKLGAKVILCSHLGRPKGKVDKKYSLKPIYDYIRCNIDDRIHWADGIVGDDIVKQTLDLDDGTSLLLENLRFDHREEANDEEFAKQLALNADYFVDDAFGVSHRKHASNDGVKKFLPSQIGLLMEKERRELSLKDTPRPFVAIMGGAKVKDKIQIIKSLLRRVDKLLIGGALSIPFMATKGMKCLSYNEESVDIAKELMDYAKKLNKQIILPVDYVASKSLTGEAKSKEVNFLNVPSDNYAVDIGKKSIRLFESHLKNAGTIFWNGPMGICEVPKFAFGTKKLIEILAKSKARTIVGGGDSAEAIEKMGLVNSFDYVSTGGGASLDYIAKNTDIYDIKKLCLVIMDGYGINEKTVLKDVSCEASSLITSKKTENIKFFKDEYPFDAVQEGTVDELKAIMNDNPHTLLHASSTMVGLPKGQMGNSEVGHLNIGAGEVVLQELLMINNLIDSGEFFKNKELNDFIKSTSGCLHIIGLASDGGIHSHIKHLYALLELCKQNHFTNVALHLITDGRDTGVNSGVQFVSELQDYIDKNFDTDKPVIASISGRYYAMDREKNWDRTDRYFKVLQGKAEKKVDAISSIKESYAKGITDEFIEPLSLASKHLSKNDSVLFFNFRADRMRQIVEKVHTLDVKILTFTEYNKDFDFAAVAFKPKLVKNCLSEIISSFNLTQLKVAETTKYAHVTYFLNGGVEEPKLKEDRVLVDMLDVPPFDLEPHMRAKEVCDEVIKGFDKEYDFIAVNFANADMVGHTGNFEASVEAVRFMSENVVRLINSAKVKGYIVVIVADHGNSEIMRKGENVCTTHTSNRVPFVICNAGNLSLRSNGCLCDITPTILELMNLTH